MTTESHMHDVADQEPGDVPEVLEWSGPALTREVQDSSDVLWTGPVTVLLPDDREVRGEGRVRWHWRPFSDLRIEVDSAEHSAVSSPPFDLVGLRLDDGAISEVTTLSQSDRPPTTVRTLSAEWITIGDPSLGARQVRFLVPNFR